MKWFKHDSDASTDAKIKKLIIRHGAVGYAVYFHCLELVASSVNETNINFELEHDSEIIADNLKINGDGSRSGREIVEEIMRTIVGLDLFQENNNHIYCFKLLKRLDASMTSNKQMRKLIAEAKENYNKNHDTVMTKSCCSHDTIMLEEKRRDEIRKDDYIPPTQEEVVQYVKERNSCIDPYRFFEYYKNTDWTYTDSKGKIKKVMNWKNKLITWETKNKDKTPYFSKTEKNGILGALQTEEDRKYLEEMNSHNKVAIGYDDID